MKIDSSAVNMSAVTQKTEAYVKKETLQIAKDGMLISYENTEGYIEDEVSISNISSTNKDVSVNTAATNRVSAPSFDLSTKDNMQIMLLQKMLESLTGKKFKFFVPEAVAQGTGNTPTNGAGMPSGVQGVRFEMSESYVEQESMSFSAEGVIKTADGKSISFSVEMNMSRSFASSSSISFQAGSMNTMDPLVINFAGSSAELTDTKFRFDLDNDGNMDSISFTGQGSGFLSLDINGDGVINNGSELFGPKSGDGFADLAQYDDDGNGWIDENDAIYDKLRIWTKDKNGNDKLFALGAKGIGAIYLGNTQSDFSIKDGLNDMMGQVRKTGVFIRENGTAGTIQHVDLAL